MQTDPTKEVEGTWVEWPDDTYNFKFKLRRTGGKNSDFAELVDETLRPLRRMANSERAKGSKESMKKLRLKMMEELARLYAEYIVVDWDGPDICDPEGNPLPFSKENAARIFIDLPEVFDWVVSSARDTGVFRDEIDLDIEEKN
jgi:hypothetical protein